MTRDDSTGGWVPVGGGGLSYVALRKISVFSIPSGDTLPNGTTAEPKVEFLITGHRISDNVVSRGEILTAFLQLFCCALVFCAVHIS